MMIAGLRGLGLPAAYVSGYLRTIPPPGKPRLQGADATHAWVSLWCGAEIGWVGFDPTNDLLVENDHIVLAVGRDFSDVSPVDGIIVGSRKQKLARRGRCAAGGMTRAFSSEVETGSRQENASNQNFQEPQSALELPRCHCARRGGCGPDVRQRRRPTRAIGSAARAGETARREDPDFRRRALQLYQFAHQPCEFSVGQSALLYLRAEWLHAARLHRTGRQLRHCLSREDARAVVLRRLLAADRRDAAGGVPQGACATAFGHANLRGRRRARAASSSSPIRASFTVDPWWSQPEARRFPKWEQAVWGTGLRSNSV